MGIEDKITVLVNGKEDKKLKERILKKAAAVEEFETNQKATGINITFRNLQKKFNKAAGQPSKLRDVIFEICTFLDKWSEEDLKASKITKEIINFFREWQSILKPIQ